MGGGGGVARKGKRGGLGTEGKAPLPFPLARAFLPPPPVFAPATQARDQVVSREGSRENTLVGIIILYDYSIIMMRLGMTRRITPISEGVIRLCVIAPACVTWEGESARRAPLSFPFPFQCLSRWL